ncbi:MAG TPA: adenosine kinase [Desulfotignum sp.]|nr:adenosine kinase [Desulfotignum sp.]
MTQQYNKRITGVGSALVDILINETDDFLNMLDKKKGGMTLVEAADIDHILAKTDVPPVVVPGGAACNTIIGVGRLGGAARFIGRRGQDNFGILFEDALRSARVEPVLTLSSSPTGSVISVITPDAQRSMFTYLGASTEMDPARITPDLFTDTAISIIEGYLLFNPDLLMASVQSAKKAGSLVALDLASFEVVNACRPILGDVIREYVDILIANEDEAAAFTGFTQEEKAIDALSQHVTYAVLKLGKRGSCVSFDNTVTRIAAKTDRPPKDTTGAGDLWAAGFLFGIANGFSIEKSGALASACGYEVCQVVGAQIPKQKWEKIRSTFSQTPV